MNVNLLTVLLTCLISISGLSLQADDSRLATPHPDLYKRPPPPVGRLGLPIGTFAVIEGTDRAPNMTIGSDDFVIERINGMPVPHEITIPTEWTSYLDDKRTPGKHYILHGYERGEWLGAKLLPKTEMPPQIQIGDFFFQQSFVVTSVEKVDGVVSAHALPVDPTVPLAQPDFNAKIDTAVPMGQLGLPLGTFAVVEIHLPQHIVMLESPFDIDKINGLTLKEPVTMTIRDVPKFQKNEHLVLRGFETGGWGNTPQLPKSENPSGSIQQQPFQSYHRFVITSPVRNGG